MDVLRRDTHIGGDGESRSALVASCQSDFDPHPPERINCLSGFSFDRVGERDDANERLVDGDEDASAPECLLARLERLVCRGQGDVGTGEERFVANLDRVCRMMGRAGEAGESSRDVAANSEARDALEADDLKGFGHFGERER